MKKASNKKQTEWLFAVGEEFYEKQNYNRAKRCFEKVLKQFRPGMDELLKADVYAYLGDIALLEGDPKKAYEYVRHAISVDPKFAHYHYMAAVISGALEDFKSAIHEVSLAVELEPENSLYLEELGRVYLFQSEFGSAEKYLRRAVDHDPKNIGAILELVTCYFQQKKYKRFVSETEKFMSDPALVFEMPAQDYLNGLLEVARTRLKSKE